MDFLANWSRKRDSFETLIIKTDTFSNRDFPNIQVVIFCLKQHVGLLSFKYFRPYKFLGESIALNKCGHLYLLNRQTFSVSQKYLFSSFYEK